MRERRICQGVSSLCGNTWLGIRGMHKKRSLKFSAIRTRLADLLVCVATAGKKEFQTLQVLSAARAESSGRRLYV